MMGLLGNKRVISTLLVAVLLLCLFPIEAFANTANDTVNSLNDRLEITARATNGNDTDAKYEFVTVTQNFKDTLGTTYNLAVASGLSKISNDKSFTSPSAGQIELTNISDAPLRFDFSFTVGPDPSALQICGDENLPDDPTFICYKIDASDDQIDEFGALVDSAYNGDIGITDEDSLPEWLTVERFNKSNWLERRSVNDYYVLEPDETIVILLAGQLFFAGVKVTDTCTITFSPGVDEEGTTLGTATSKTYSVNNEYAELPSISSLFNTVLEQMLEKGMRFMGWADNDGTMFGDGAAYPLTNVAIGSQTTLTAMWGLSGYNIHFDGGNENVSGAMGNLSDIQPGDPVTLPLNSFFLLDHVFDGWLDAVNGYTYADGDTIPGGRYEGGTTVELTAQWKKIETAEVEDGEITIGLKAGERAVFKDLPAGIDYKITEIYVDGENVGVAPPGWTLNEEIRASGKIPANDTASADFVNHYEAGQTSGIIRALKYFDGEPAAAGAFQFTLTETSAPAGGSHESQTINNEAGGTITFATITYTVVGTYEYAITETQNWHAGVADETIAYDSDTEIVTVVVSDDGEGHLSAKITYDEDGANFENFTKPGNLSITKLEENANKAFTFHVRLKNPDGSPYSPDSLPENVTGEAGNYAFTLSHSQTVVFTGLAAGTQYTVSEDSQDGWRMKQLEGSLNGVIPANDTAAVTVTNIYAVGPGGGASTFTYVQAHKKLENGSLQAGQFEFMLTELWYPGKAESTEHSTLSSALTATNGIVQEAMDDNDTDPWVGSALVRFDAITFDTPGSYAYKITEILPDEPDPTIAYSDDIKYVWIEVVDDGKGRLNPTVSYSNGADGWEEADFWSVTESWTADTSWSSEEANEPLFTNRMTFGDLKVSKNLEDATERAKLQSFEFVFSFVDSEGIVLSDDYQYLVYEQDGSVALDSEAHPISGNVTTGGSVLLRGEQYVIIKNIPHGATYSISEKSNDAGFRLKGKSGDTGQIIAGQTQEAQFTNIYSATGYAEIEVYKTFVGGTIMDNQFQIRAVDENGDEKKVYIVPDSLTADTGKATIIIDYTLNDNNNTFTYVISEVIPENDETVVYDTHSETVKVSVSDAGDGTLSTAVTYDAAAPEGKEGEDIYTDGRAAFTNRKNYSLNVGKYVAGNMGHHFTKFAFTLTLTQNDEGYDIGPLPSGWSVDSSTPGVYHFNLAHGDFVRLVLPADVVYSVSEDPLEYTPSYSVTSMLDGSILDQDSESSFSGGTFNKERGDQTITFTNTKSVAVPTNARVSTGGEIAMVVALAGLAWVAVMKKKKRGRHHRAG